LRSPQLHIDNWCLAAVWQVGEGARPSLDEPFM
jgi:hypothetical protein